MPGLYITMIQLFREGSGGIGFFFFFFTVPQVIVMCSHVPTKVRSHCFKAGASKLGFPVGYCFCK